MPHAIRLPAPYAPFMGYAELRKGRWSNPNEVYHIVFNTLYQHPYFLDLTNARSVVNAIRREENLGNAATLCFCVMPDHCHWLMSPARSKPLSTVVNNVKSFSARSINNANQTKGAIWHRGFFDRGLRSDEDLAAVARYIVANPVRAGLVDSVRNYPHWDATWI